MPAAFPTTTTDDMSRPYRGTCKYKSGRCLNERTLKYNGDIHTLCEEHRQRHNQIQCKSDTKIRRQKRMLNLAKTTQGKPEENKWRGVSSPKSPSMITVSLDSWLMESTNPMDHFASIMEFPVAPSYTMAREEWTPEDECILASILGLDETQGVVSTTVGYYCL
ncbi:Aste57867_6884 [Aphanomyces stellatus]|uniref:Aste57867_1133 protein n=1 Tax=Aphanomyces stellatus TaxID=120398 RepID=A0A485KHR3_9STRA|nr:hypothetical protein As57867_006862 [Aphanomyces stellatus]KAF0719285.1 hypothetical protein As57867_001132 [Aphanomyces stellatus]VFT78353.1 Aste57867_1133 [Aphanomyces stellatus]VFT83841.1 Aste57867_6884 [Aphanomyces stellatus]